MTALALHDESIVRIELRKAVKAEGGAQTFAQKHKFPESLVTRVIENDAAPTPRLCSIVGFFPVTRYVRKGEGA